jgi:hypothetical protein
MMKSCKKNDTTVPLMFMNFFHRHMRVAVACAWPLVLLTRKKRDIDTCVIELKDNGNSFAMSTV